MLKPVCLAGHFLYVTVPDGGLQKDWAVFQSPRLEPTNSTHPCKASPHILFSAFFFFFGGSGHYLRWRDLSRVRPLPAVDGHVHAPVWAEIWRTDGSGG